MEVRRMTQQGRLARRIAAAAVVAVVSLGSPGVGMVGVSAAAPTGSVLGAASPVGVADIVAGSAGRTSIALTATYEARLKLSWAHHRIRVDATLAISNSSGGPIDVVELNTIAARLGHLRLDPVTVDGVAVPAVVSDQTIRVPLGGVLPIGGTTRVRVRYGADLRTTLGGSDWMFTKANGIADIYRWLPWVSRSTPFSRPNHGDPFVTPDSAFVRVTVVTDRRLVLATSGDRVSVSGDGLTQVFEARHVRDFTVTAATDYAVHSRTVGGHVIRVYTRPGTAAGPMLDAAADAFVALQARLGPYPHPTYRVVQSSGRYGMESPGLIWIPTGAPAGNLRYLIAHETAHQWFYGVVGNDQARDPYADEAATDFLARYVTHLHRSSRCPAGRLDLAIYDYTARCYYEKVYIQGGNLIDAARHALGSSAFWAALRGYVDDHRFGMSDTKALLQALDDATSKDIGRTLFARWFPRLY